MRSGETLVVETPLPKPGPGQVLVQVSACGVCRTDLHIVDGDLAHPKLPLILGHQIAGRVMIRQKSGSIINIASVLGVVGITPDKADGIAYPTSKGALITFTKDLAAKWARHNIRVNAIAPGWFPTEMTKLAFERNGERILTLIPMGRFGETEELKGAVVYLASDASRYVTGIVLPVDGGLLAV